MSFMGFESFRSEAVNRLVSLLEGGKARYHACVSWSSCPSRPGSSRESGYTEQETTPMPDRPSASPKQPVQAAPILHVPDVNAGYEEIVN